MHDLFLEVKNVYKALGIIRISVCRLKNMYNHQVANLNSYNVDDCVNSLKALVSHFWWHEQKHMEWREQKTLQTLLRPTQ